MSRIANWVLDKRAASRTGGRRSAWGVTAASLMTLTLAAAHGGFAAAKTKTDPVKSAEATTEAAAEAEAQPAAILVKAPDIKGRWSGTHYSYGAARAKCDGGPCTLTLDITACGEDWCGVLVKADGSCATQAMKVHPGEGKETWLHFDGKLELDPKAAPYVVQATLWRSDDDPVEKPHLDIVGDTGPEMMFMRRSFPFQAHLARSGEPVCTSDKATS